MVAPPKFTRLASFQQGDAKLHITNHFELLSFTRFHQALESGSGRGGRRFKSSLPDQLFPTTYGVGISLKTDHLVLAQVL